MCIFSSIVCDVYSIFHFYLVRWTAVEFDWVLMLIIRCLFVSFLFFHSSPEMRQEEYTQFWNYINKKWSEHSASCASNRINDGVCVGYVRKYTSKMFVIFLHWCSTKHAIAARMSDSQKKKMFNYCFWYSKYIDEKWKNRWAFNNWNHQTNTECRYRIFGTVRARSIKNDL